MSNSLSGSDCRHPPACGGFRFWSAAASFAAIAPSSTAPCSTGGFVAYLGVDLSHHTKTAQEAFEAAVTRAKEVRECHNVTGTVEYILRVEAADLVAFKHFHTEIFGVIPFVSSITSYVVMDSPKDERPFPAHAGANRVRRPEKRHPRNPRAIAL